MDTQENELGRYWLEQALIHAKAFEDPFRIAQVHFDLARIELDAQNYAAARSHLRKTLQLAWGIGYMWAAFFPLVWLTKLFAAQNEN